MNIKEKKITDLHVSIPESAGKDTKLINMNILAGLGHFYIARQQQKTRTRKTLEINGLVRIIYLMLNPECSYIQCFRRTPPSRFVSLANSGFLHISYRNSSYVSQK